VLITRTRHRGEDRVTFFDKGGHLHWLLVAWTSIDEPDAFSRTAAGRSWLRMDDLARLRALVDEVHGALQGRKGVKKDTPHT
jgi:hypothetical protein